MTDDPRHARFALEHARITRIKPLPKVVFVSVHCQAGRFPSYYDVVCFDLAAASRLNIGDVVTVTGEIRMQKPKDGGRTWTPELVAIAFKPGDKAKAPPPRETRSSGSAARHRDEHVGAAVEDIDELPF